MKRLQNLTFSALCLALCFLLPFLTAQNQQLGTMICPMHIPVFLCAFLCGWKWGMGVGFVAPILRSLLFGMPPLYPIAVGLMFELAAYGAVAGLMRQALPPKKRNVYLSLVVAMLAGRVFWGITRYAFMGLFGTEFSLKIFFTTAFITAWPGIVIHILAVPVAVFALERVLKKKALPTV